RGRSNLIGLKGLPVGDFASWKSGDLNEQRPFSSAGGERARWPRAHPHPSWRSCAAAYALQLLIIRLDQSGAGILDGCLPAVAPDSGCPAPARQHLSGAEET